MRRSTLGLVVAIALAISGLTAALPSTRVAAEAAPLPSNCEVLPSTSVRCTFDYTGSVQTWRVPAGVTAATFVLRGAAGGGSQEENAEVGGTGGRGARVAATLQNLQDNQVLEVRVGGAPPAPWTLRSHLGGYNGGGNGSRSLSSSGGGGGATDIRPQNGGLDSRLIVAAGGGGDASFHTNPSDDYNGEGGAGGGSSNPGATGESPTNLPPGVTIPGGEGGGAGTSTRGGSGGRNGGYPAVLLGDGANGQAGVGGAGGVPDPPYYATFGGGGGGGWYGGGGGGAGGALQPCGDRSYCISGAGGGGGGSNYWIPTATQVEENNGVNPGHGSAVVIYSRLPSTTSLTALTAPLSSPRAGDPVGLVAHVSGRDLDGTVTFSGNDMVDACSAAPLQPTPTPGQYVASCRVGFLRAGSYTVTARFSGNDGHAPSSDQLTLNVRPPANLLIHGARFQGLGGSRDDYVVLYNPTSEPANLAAWRLETSDGGSEQFDIESVPPGGYYLVAGNQLFGADRPGPSDHQLSLDLPAAGGVRLIGPDGTVMDAIGTNRPEAAGYREGTGLPPIQSPQTCLCGYERNIASGAPVDTGSNATDFEVVADDGDLTDHSAGAVLGAPAVRGTTSPVVANPAGLSSLFDPSVSAAQAPNREISNGILTVRRTLVNRTDRVVTAMRLRLTKLTTYDRAAPVPGQAILMAQSSTTATVNSSRGVRTVQGLTLESPPSRPGKGGLFSTLRVPLPGGSLTPNEAVDVAIQFRIVAGGQFSFGYNVEVDWAD